MILDERTELGDALALSTAGTALVLIGDVIDTSIGRNWGNSGNGGKQLFLVISVDTAVTSAGAATLAFVLASDAQAAIAVDGTATEHARTQQIPKAQLVAGYTYVIAVPPEGNNVYERFVGVLQLALVAALTAGKVNIYLTLDVKAWKAVPDGI